MEEENKFFETTQKFKTEISLIPKEKSIIERNKIYLDVLKKYNVKIYNNVVDYSSEIVNMSYKIKLTKTLSAISLTNNGFTALRNNNPRNNNNPHNNNRYKKIDEEIVYIIRKEFLIINCSHEDLGKAKKNIKELVPNVYDGEIRYIVYLYNIQSNLFKKSKLFECNISEFVDSMKVLWGTNCVENGLNSVKIKKKKYVFVIYGIFKPYIQEFYKLKLTCINSFEELEEAKKIAENFLKKLKFYKILPHYYDCKIICLH